MDILTTYPLIKISQLHVFVLIAENGNFMKTAKILGLTQPAISSSIKQLESSMNATLFYRTTKHIELTSVGENVLPHAKKLLEVYKQTLGALDTTKQSAQDVINIAVLPSIANTFLPQILSEYLAKQPLVKLNIIDTTSLELFQKVMRKEVDFSIGNLPSLSNEILFKPLLEDRLGLVCNAKNPITQQPEKHNWNSILQHPNFIGNGLELLMAYEGMHIPEHRIFVRNITMLKILIKQDIGITALPDLLCKILDAGTSYITIDQPVVKRTIGIFHHKSLFLSAHAEDLINRIKQFFSSQEAEK